MYVYVIDAWCFFLLLLSPITQFVNSVENTRLGTKLVGKKEKATM
jgi:hypothetical protein